jgi:EAL domain-containing protein (putative c-di-GMP-specific phosphodiesterase class I)
VARLGGDEFTVLLEDVSDTREVIAVAERIEQELSLPFNLGGHEVFTTASIGIAPSSTGYERPDDILRDADTAMYRAKSMGKARHEVFDQAMHARAVNLLNLETDLRRALDRREFAVYYQPIVSLDSDRLVGWEALVRWHHPTRGLVSPALFIPVAEDTGLIVPIGRWLLGEASRDFARWRRANDGAGPLTLNVNVSPKQLQHADLLASIDGIVEEHGLRPSELVLELTEHTFQDSGHAARIGELRDRGLQLYMDDFGTGACSLNSLLRLQLDSLKIDRSLFSGGSPRGQAPELVRTIVSLARDMGTQVVAEGVETAEQLGFLREVGCGAAQGFYFSPPVDGAEAAALVGRSASW